MHQVFVLGALLGLLLGLLHEFVPTALQGLTLLQLGQAALQRVHFARQGFTPAQLDRIRVMDALCVGKASTLPAAEHKAMWSVRIVLQLRIRRAKELQLA